MYSHALKKGKGKTAKRKYSRTQLIHNLLATYIFVVCNFSYLEIVDILFIV